MKTKNDLLERIEYLESQLQEAEETIDAIRNDKVDALVVSTRDGDQVYTLEGAEKPYRIFLEQMNEGAITLSSEGVILYCNNKFAELLNASLETVIGSSIYKWTAFTDIEALSCFIHLSEEEAKSEVALVSTDGRAVFLYLSLKRILSDNSDVILCVVATDLTEKKKNEEIVAAEKLARSILEQAADAIVVCNDKLKIVRHSKAAEELAGRKIMYSHFDEVFSLVDSKLNPIQLNTILNSENQIEIVLIKNSTEKYNLIVSVGVLTGPNQNVIGYVLNLTNITKHIEAEEKLAHSLKEKTVLLKEIHHRVKNNLQIISSLLRLQSGNIEEASVIGILNECQNRITSMALIHQKLYESEKFARVNIASYLQEFVSYLCRTYMFNQSNINLLITEDDFYFSIDAAVPLGLIINELVSNSFKHAFKNKNGTSINNVEIAFDKLEENKFLLIVKDNGEGFPKNVDFFNPETLGLQLVNTLIEQINGTIEMNTSSSGTEIKMNFTLVE